MADDPTGPALTKLINAEIKEIGKELEKYKAALRKVAGAAEKPGTVAANEALRGAQALMLDIIESHIVLHRILGSVTAAQRAVRDLTSMGEKHQGEIAVQHVNGGGSGLIQIGPYGGGILGLWRPIGSLR